MIRLAKAFDARRADEQERGFARIATAVSKYWLCKRSPVQVGEALECLGGNGYVEESVMPRLYREAPLYSIWEGSGNVICLDVLRSLAKEPAALDALIAEMRLGTSDDKQLQAHVSDVEFCLRKHAQQVAKDGGSDLQWEARRLSEKAALALQASLLLRHAPAELAEAFCQTRLRGDYGHTFGTLPKGTAAQAILDRFCKNI